MGRPPGKIHDQVFQMRVSAGFIRALDDWRKKQVGKPSRAEAVRLLVEMSLNKSSKKK